MEITIGIIVGLLLGGFVLGGIVGWFVAAARGKATAGTISSLSSQLEANQKDVVSLRSALGAEQELRVKAETQLAQASINIEEQKALLKDAQAKLTDTFKALSGDALNSNNQAFLELAKKTFQTVVTEAKGDLGKKQQAIDAMVKPIRETLSKYEMQIRELETNRGKAYAALVEQVKNMGTAQEQLRRETGNLVTALRRPQVRGRWGEITLRRVAELAGMNNHCDFYEQVTVDTDDGKYRPDMVVHLPGEREIVVDSKVALDGYLQALESQSEEQRAENLATHARQIRDHMKKLSAKSYWDAFEQSPDFVVMFIPGESFLAAALDIDPKLIEDAMENHIVISTPSTLVALLRAVEFGWRQESITQNARKISALGKELHERIRTMAAHFTKLGRSLHSTNEAYNKTVGSMERMVLPSARKFKELGATGTEEIPTIEQIDITPRELNLPEESPEKSEE
ncbi:MAG: DNA recombination protein RmuC [Phycisphaerae bacterium]|nr:DNA recombination protein RmuC [Phycisphaerae bacterium]